MRETTDTGRIAYAVVVPLTPTAKRPTVARRRATERAVKAIQDVVDRFAPKDVETFAARIEGALGSPTQTPPRTALARELGGKRTYSQEEQAMLEAETLIRSFRLRESLLAGSLTAPQVADVLGTSRQTPHDRVKSGTLIAVLDNGALRFPPWQFDPEGPDRVIAGFPDTLRSLPSDMSALAKVNWFVRSNPYLEGRTPLDALKQHEIARVVDLARALGPT
jgi:hypothetical protein